MAGLVALRALPDRAAILSFAQSLLASRKGVAEVSLDESRSLANHKTILELDQLSERITVPVAYKRQLFATFQIRFVPGHDAYLPATISNFANMVALELSHREITDSLTDVVRRQNQENSKLSAMTMFAAESSGIGVWEFDLDSHDLVWNEQMFKIFGKNPDEVRGSFEDWASSLHPDDADTAKAELQSCIESKQPFRTGFRIMQPDGGVRHIDARAEFYDDETTGKHLLIGTNIDVTDTKELESQLQHSRRLEAVGKLTGGIAHDFNNLLQVISGSLQLLEANLSKQANTDPALFRYLANTTAAVDSASSLTSSLLAFSRRNALSPANTSLSALLADVGLLLTRSLGESIDLKLDVPEDLPALYIDKHQLENALINLAVNARDAMPNGGELRIRAMQPKHEHLLIAGERIDGAEFVSISIEDSGLGMDAKVLEQAFDPFYTTKKVGEGSGLGLSMVHGFVKQSGGYVTIHSEPGSGTLVRLYLPKAEGDAAAIVADTSPKNRQDSLSLRVLLVEDHPSVRDVTENMLTELGHRVCTEADARSAIDLLKDEDGEFDVLFTDLVLPGEMSGLELGRAVSQDWPDIKIVFVSGYNERFKNPEEGLVLGHNFLKKPFKQADIMKIIDHLMPSEAEVRSIEGALRK